MRYHLLIIAFLLFSFNASAVQPVWVVQALNNIRRAAAATSKGVKTAKTLGKCANALPDSKIDELADIADGPNGLKELNQILGKANYIARYGDDAGHIILQDTYLRIAIKNGRISKEMAEQAMENLPNAPGLTSLLGKINSTSFSQAKGHLRELELAIHSQQRGFTPVSFGQKFADGLKKGDTDLDVHLLRNGMNYAIESKAYAGHVPNDMIRADAESLLAFCKNVGNTKPVFCFETPPSEAVRLFLKERNITYLTGTASEIATKLDIISSLK